MESIPCFTLVLAILHDAGLLSFCSNACDWNEELILQFYATFHLSGDVDDLHSWAWTGCQNTHYKAPSSEFFRALPIDIPQENAHRIYEEPKLPPLTEGEAPRTTFLSKRFALCASDSVSHSGQNPQSNQMPQFR